MVLRRTDAFGPPQLTGLAPLQPQGVRVAKAEARQAATGGEDASAPPGFTEPAGLRSVVSGLGLSGGEVLPSEGLQLQPFT